MASAYADTDKERAAALDVAPTEKRDRFREAADTLDARTPGMPTSGRHSPHERGLRRPRPRRR